MGFHSGILTNLKDNYLKPLFKKNHKQWKDITIKVKLPPGIPSQENGHDCGVFLLMFAKFLLLDIDFDFDTADMIHMRDKIRNELTSGQVSRNIHHGKSRKRKGSRTDLSTKKVKKVNSNQCPQRRIINPDAETC